MSWAMRLYNTTDKRELIAQVVVNDEVPVYLRAYDVNAHDGRGSVAMTRDIAEARTWCTQHEVMLAWLAQSTSKPLRPDGKPNRPLTAYSMHAVPV